MENVQTYRDMASICRKRAVFDPEHKNKHLGDAERWEHLAQAEIVSHFRGRAADMVYVSSNTKRGWLVMEGD